MKVKWSQGGVPVGSYMATFKGVENVPADEVRGYKAGLKWLFEVGGNSPHKGQGTSRITGGDVPSPKNAMGKFLSGMLGRAGAIDEETDLEPMIGRPFFIVVAQTENGGTRVESATPPPQQ